MKLTKEIIHSAASGRFQNGFNYHQLKLMGIPWPPRAGWVARLVGREVPDETWDMILRLSGKPKSMRRRLLMGQPEAEQVRFNFTAD